MYNGAMVGVIVMAMLAGMATIRMLMESRQRPWLARSPAVAVQSFMDKASSSSQHNVGEERSAAIVPAPPPLVHCEGDWQQCYPRVLSMAWRMMRELSIQSDDNSGEDDANYAVPCGYGTYGMMMPSFYDVGNTAGPSNDTQDHTEQHQFVLVIGVEGSGSTWLHKLLPTRKLPISVRKGLGALMHKVWSSGPLATVTDARRRLVQEIQRDLHITVGGAAERGGRQTKPMDRTSLHVSCPDWDHMHYPDLHSSVWQAFRQAGVQLKVVATFRDPRESAYSNFRRNWPHVRVAAGTPSRGRGPLKPDVVASARSTDQHLTLLSAQLSSLPMQDVLVVHYEALIFAPERTVGRLAQFLRLSSEEEATVVSSLRERARKDHDKFRQRLNAEQVAFLDGFFDDQRTSKWLCMERRSRWTDKDRQIASASAAAAAATKGPVSP
jgi:hypothetical protein